MNDQWAKWRKDLIEPVWAWHSVPYGIVRTIIEAGEAQAARLAELEAWAENAHVQGGKDREGCASFWWDGGPNATMVQRPCNCKPWKRPAAP